MTAVIARRLRLLLVVDSLDIGGAEQHVIDLARELARRGHDVTIACSVTETVRPGRMQTDAPSVCDKRCLIPCEVLPLLDHPVKRTLSLAYARALRRLIATRRFDLVHVHLYASSAAATLAAVGTGIPLIVTEHTEGTWQDVCERGVTGQYVRRAVHVVAVSEGIKRRVVEDLGVDGGRVSVVSNAIPACPAPSPAVPVGLRLSGRPCVGVVARLCHEKGVDLFLQAVARIAPLHPDAGFVVIGDGPSRADLEAQAAHPGLTGRVSFLGEIPGVRFLLSELDLLVVPSRTEGTPLVVLEAISAGVPLVAARAGGIPSQIRDGIDGLLVPPENAMALAEAMDRLLRDTRLRHCMAEAARSTVLSGGHGLMVDRIEGLYQAYAYGAVCDGARVIRRVRRKRGSHCEQETQPYRSIGC